MFLVFGFLVFLIFLWTAVCGLWTDSFMRYAVFADVHSNLAAFEAVLEAFKKAEVDSYVFVGDIIGYGANPHECIALLKSLNAICVAGNHDQAVVDLFDLYRFNDSAKKALIWTKTNISEIDKQFLAGFKLIEEKKSFCLVHGTLNDPQDFHYLMNKSDAAKTFYCLKRQLCFVGHSHIPGIFVEEDGVRYEMASFLPLEKSRRYIVNVGSVGQPRDENPDACFCVYDEEASTVEIKRVPYDIARAQRDILNAGLPPVLAQRLEKGR